MPQAFLIMPIGDPELDRVAASAMVPALAACGLDPKRVDKHNAGNLLKSEIIGFIEAAEIIVADLTHARPNCYLEVGYAMGVDKFKDLILTVREDHFLDSENHKKDGPKIHFDLAGYDILRWHPNGIAAEIPREGRDDYDYWALRRTGEFYWRGTLFEDDRTTGQIFFDTRIVRVTEALLYCARLYTELGMDRLRVVTITVRHVGLSGCRLSNANPGRTLHDRRDPAHENESAAQITVRLEQLESELVSLVKEILAPLFALFDFFELNEKVYEDIVNRFVEGRV